jgi:hypothetical protein
MTCLDYLITLFHSSENNTEDTARDWLIKSHKDQRVKILELIKERNDLRDRLDDKTRIKLPLSDDEVIEFIKFYHDCYFNTAQDVKDFAGEYFYVIGEIISGRIPIILSFLTDYKTELIEKFPQYKTEFGKIVDRGAGGIMI